jgi:hypothetical protein
VPQKIAKFTADDVERLMQDAGIVRARAKIEATIGNARAYLAMQAAGEDFSAFIWGMAGGKPIVNKHRQRADEDAAVGGDLEGAQEARLQVRRAGDRLCVDAGDRHRGRPCARLPSPPRGKVNSGSSGKRLVNARGRPG